MTNINLLVIIEAEIATTHLIEQVLRACAPHGISYKVQFLDRLESSDFTPNALPLFIRCGDPRAYSWAQTLVDANYPYLFYIDDNFWRIVGDSTLAEYYRHPIVRRSLEFTVSNATAVLTNSGELAGFLSQFNKQISILPTFFDFSLIEDVVPLSDERIRIGFSGSPSRVDDLELISPIVGPILERFPQAVFEFAGVLPNRIAPSERVLFFPHTPDYNSYIRFQAARNWAIGLAPLIDHEANRGKTDNKYREYGACRCAGIYSNIPPYSDVVKDSQTGRLVENTPSLWQQAITDLLSHPAEQAALAQAAFEDVRARYDISQVSTIWATFFKDLAAQLPRSTQSFDKKISWARKLRRRVDRARLNLSIVYHEGGAPLVVRRIIKKIMLAGK